MIKIENVVLPSPEQWDAIIRGMRNPKNSWDRSDSYSTYIADEEGNEAASFEHFIGDRDLFLMNSLAKGGSVHAKYRRMIPVIVDIVAPLYWVAEHDTYKVGTVRNSCSFMHKGLSKPFELSDFTVEDDMVEALKAVIDTLNVLRDEYLKDKDENVFFAIRQLLPQGYNVRYTWSANYEVLTNIYHSRKDHRLPEWHTFCKWIESLPYSKELITGVVENDD